jgi:hypothetical protein
VSCSMNRVDLLNYLVDRYSFDRYLEIGLASCRTFDAVVCDTKHGVDPNSSPSETLYPTGGERIIYQTTSDQFFTSMAHEIAHAEDLYDLIFIDGLHHAEQVQRDVVHALRSTWSHGVVVLHDCSPEEEAHQKVPRETSHWNGDVWRAFLGLRANPKLNVFCIDADQGLGVVVKRTNDEWGGPLADVLARPAGRDPMDQDQISFQDLEARRRDLLYLISPEEFLIGGRST